MHFDSGLVNIITDIFVGAAIAIITAAISWMSHQVSKLREDQHAENDALKVAMQSILRDRLYSCYGICRRKGGASIDDRENFENLWSQYHTLGANGVMDDIHRKFLSLPVCEEGDSVHNSNS